MGSLVMSQTAQGLSEHRNNAYGQGRMMGDNDSRPGNQQHGASRSTSQRNAMPQSSPSSARTSNTQQPPAEPSLPPHETPSDAHTLPSTAQPPESGSNHRNGFDQSGFPLTSDPRGLHSSPSSPRLGPTHRSTLSLGGSEASSPSRLKVRDLAHIQSFASQDYLNKSKLAGRILESGRQYEISSMPVSDIIEMVAGLLTKITTTNDRQHDHIHRPVPSNDGTLNSQGSCVLAFHGKNVPSITILSYLSRIHKYCPTTYEVFLSLLVYFDRMTDNFNKAFLKKARSQAARSESSDSYASSITLIDDNREEEESSYRSDMVVEEEEDEEKREEGDSAHKELDQFFVVDSFNIHRLVIAGVTCASKFFSDVFYTNSRYAKVGGLPLAELNNLELQFLILNDFRLSVPVEELEAYGTMLVEFYAREIVAQQQAADAQHQQMQQAAQHGEEMYMTGARSRSTAQSMPSST